MNYEEYMEELEQIEILEELEQLGHYQFEAEMEKMLKAELLGDEHYKECYTCGAVYPATLEYFTYREQKSSGLSSECKECSNKRHRELYATEAWKEQRRAYQQSERGKEVQRKGTKNYFSSEKGKIASFNNAHRRRVLGANTKLTKEQWKAMMNWWGWRCAYSGVVLRPDNRSVDHILAVTKGGSNDIWNLVPCDITLNRSKNNKDLETWLKEKDLYSPDLMNRLAEWEKFAKENFGADKVAQ